MIRARTVKRQLPVDPPDTIIARICYRRKHKEALGQNDHTPGGPERIFHKTPPSASYKLSIGILLIHNRPGHAAGIVIIPVNRVWGAFAQDDDLIGPGNTHGLR